MYPVKNLLFVRNLNIKNPSKILSSKVRLIKMIKTNLKSIKSDIFPVEKLSKMIRWEEQSGATKHK